MEKVRSKHIQTQSEWEEDMSKQVLEFVRSELYMDLRFLDVALSALIFRVDDSLLTFATDGTYLHFSSEQVLRVFRDNPKFLDRVYLHSVLHCIFFHLWIGGKRDRIKWNLSCDIAVEYTIDEMDKPSTKRILSWQRQKVYDELKQQGNGISAAVIYRYLSAKSHEELLQLQKEFYTDDHRYWPKEEQKSAAGESAEKQGDKIARQTRLKQKQRGDETKDGEELLAAQLEAERGKRSYKEFLRKFSVLREEMHADLDEFDLNYYTYGLRLYKNMPLIEPLESREVMKIYEFVIVVDTSYSTSGELIKNFLKETYTILTQKNSFFEKCKIHIIQCDNQVRTDEEINSSDELAKFLNRFTIVGGGGTDFRPAFAYVNERLEQGALKNLSGLLYFTDGKGIYPKKRPEYKTAFLFLEDYDETLVPPWAMRLRVDGEDFIKQEN